VRRDSGDTAGAIADLEQLVRVSPEAGKEVLPELERLRRAGSAKQ
jgi:hypothetical protein